MTFLGVLSYKQFALLVVWSAEYMYATVAQGSETRVDTQNNQAGFFG